MSTENIKLFFQKVATDNDLQAKIATLPQNDPQSLVEGLVTLSEDAGAPFTVQELTDHFSQASELTENQLSGVSGGLSSPSDETPSDDGFGYTFPLKSKSSNKEEHLYYKFLRGIGRS